MTFPIATYPQPHRTRDDRLVPGFRPTAQSLDPRGLVQLLTQFRIVPQLQHKLHLPAWAPHVLRAPHRKLDNVVSVSCLVYDYDDGTPIDDAHAAFADWTHIIHTSWSHRPEHPKFRLILPLKTLLPAEHYPAAWRWGAIRSARAVDRACKDSSRLYFLPAAPSEDSARYARCHRVGRLLDLRPFDQLPPDPQEIAAARRREENRRRWQARRIPAGEREKTAAAMLRESPDARAKAADLLGAAISSRRGGRVAHRVACPGCGDRSVWFPIDALSMKSARCNHAQSCGWFGSLLDLLTQQGVAA